jgi:hypothetical protein
MFGNRKGLLAIVGLGLLALAGTARADSYQVVTMFSAPPTGVPPWLTVTPLNLMPALVPVPSTTPYPFLNLSATTTPDTNGMGVITLPVGMVFGVFEPAGTLKGAGTFDLTVTLVYAITNGVGTIVQLPIMDSAPFVIGGVEFTLSDFRLPGMPPIVPGLTTVGRSETTIRAVPEPSSLVLMAGGLAGLLGLGCHGWRRSGA